MPQDYGPLAGLVGTVGSIVAAAGAIALAWRGRSRWEPSETDIANGPQRVGGLLTTVLIVVLWVLTRGGGGSLTILSALAIGLAVVAVVALLGYGFVTSTQTYDDLKLARKIIGGFRIVPAARRDIKKKELTVQQYFSGAGYDPDEVWPRGSRASAKLLFVLLYLLLTVSGGVAVAASAILVEKQTASTPPTTASPTPSPTSTPSVAARTLRWVDAPTAAAVLDGGTYEPGKSVWLQELFPASPPSAFHVSETIDNRLPAEVRQALSGLMLPQFAPTLSGFAALSDSSWRLPQPFEGVGYRSFFFTDDNPEGAVVQSGTLVSGRASVAVTSGTPDCLQPDANGTVGGTVGESSCLDFTVTTARDPTFDVRILVPWGTGDTDLVAGVGRYLESLEARLTVEDPASQFSARAALDIFVRENVALLPRKQPAGWVLTADPTLEVGSATAVPVRVAITAGSAGAALLALQLLDRTDGSAIMSPLVPIMIGGNAAPAVSIIEPASDLLGADRLAYTDFDQGKWFTEVKLVAEAMDPEDGVLGGESITWTTDRIDLQPVELGSGEAIRARLYAADCEGGAIHTITVIARDSQGDEVSATRRIEIGQLC
jgi:hypothetical protein